MSGIVVRGAAEKLRELEHLVNAAPDENTRTRGSTEWGCAEREES